MSRRCRTVLVCAALLAQPALDAGVATPQSLASARVTGAPGQIRPARTGCAATAAVAPALRRRIVDIATTEWAFFRYGVVDQTMGEVDEDDWPRPPEARGRGRVRIAPDEAARVASAIAGYWTVTPEGAWIINRQNDAWRGDAGIGARWNSPWSAAFISWVLCEAGVSDTNIFHRAVAHHRYIDQAIRARDGAARQAAYVAYDAGEAAVIPGDLLCSGRRPAYRTLAERRRQMGTGATTHCDIVVSVDVERRRFLAIGGNVRGAVSLKVIPGEWDARAKRLRPLSFTDRPVGDNPYRGARPIFAHLQMRAGAIADDALTCEDSSQIPAAARALCGTQGALEAGPSGPASIQAPAGFFFGR